MARKQKKIHYIYKTTCSVTKRYYIGMHSTDRLDDGYLGSGTRLWYSLNYHGKENHTKEILEYCNSREELRKREEEIVNEQLLTEGLCMNLKTGGDGGFSSKEHMMKCSRAGNEAKKRLLATDEEYAKRHSENSSKILKKLHKEGKVPYGNFKGKTHSEETKKLMGESSKGNGVGNTNSQYGTCWVNNGKEVKKIKKEDLETYTNGGWVRGRKLKLSC